MEITLDVQHILMGLFALMGTGALGLVGYLWKNHVTSQGRSIGGLKEEVRVLKTDVSDLKVDVGILMERTKKLDGD